MQIDLDKTTTKILKKIDKAQICAFSELEKIVRENVPNKEMRSIVRTMVGFKLRQPIRNN